MIPEAFEYHCPTTLEEAWQAMAETGEDGKIVAGGHSLIPMMKLRLASPKYLIDIGRIEELRNIREEDGGIEIGALATHHQIEASDLLKLLCPLLPETASEIGDVQVRNMGTIGGSLAHADPAADWPAAILALEAEIEARSAHGARWIKAADYFVDLMTTALEPDEILTRIRVPAVHAHTGQAYLKLHHPASGYAMVGVAVCLTLAESGVVAKLAVGLTGAGAKAVRAVAVEEVLSGKTPKDSRLNEAAAVATQGMELNGDLYASAEYRGHLARVYTRRALAKALERARGTA
ncbi:MAG TPA: xanthine dehydrogenase family protein subunit M [Terriglobia bacterium]|nr:xanthine dehydrogenase family protein subunit M [Terriglobia bacterium]